MGIWDVDVGETPKNDIAKKVKKILIALKSDPSIGQHEIEKTLNIFISRYSNMAKL